MGRKVQRKVRYTLTGASCGRRGAQTCLPLPHFAYKTGSDDAAKRQVMPGNTGSGKPNIPEGKKSSSPHLNGFKPAGTPQDVHSGCTVLQGTIGSRTLPTSDAECLKKLKAANS